MFDTVPHRKLHLRRQASARLAGAAVVPQASATARARTWTAGHCTGQRSSPVGTVGKFATVSEFLHIKGRNFPDVFPFTSAYDSYEP